MDEVVGLFLSRLSGFAARCGGRDLATRRAIDQAVYDLRLEISEAATKLADQRGEPPLAEMTDDEVRRNRSSVRIASSSNCARRSMRRQLILPAPALTHHIAGFAGSLTRLTRCLI